MEGGESESEAPVLADPFIANDSLFVQVHLKFVKSSDMPPVELSANEIRLLSRYVAEIHRAKYPSISEQKADVRCPVCYAFVSSQTALENKLYVTYLGDKYYFECPQCVDTFKKAPQAFIELSKQIVGETSAEKL